MMVAINASGRVLLKGGPRDFVHIFNNVAGETRLLVLTYDGQPINQTSMYQTIQIKPGASLLLTNSGNKPIFSRDIWLACIEAGNPNTTEFDFSVLGVAPSEVIQSALP